MVGVFLLPLVLTQLSPWRSDLVLVYSGLLPAMMALPAGRRVAAGTAAAAAAALFLGLLLSGSVWGAAAFMGVVALLVAASYTRGWQTPAMYVGIKAALAAVAAPVVDALDTSAREPSDWVNAAAAGCVVLLAGLWVALVGSAVAPGEPRPGEVHAWDRDLAVFAGLLVGLLVCLTVLVKAYLEPGHSWWFLLTVLVTLRPSAAGSIARALQRAGGTALGGLLAGALAVSVDRPVLTILGLAAAVGCAVLHGRVSYAVFSALLTAALVLLTFGSETVLRDDLVRVGYTAVAAAVVVLVSVVVDRGRARWGAPRPGEA